MRNSFLASMFWVTLAISGVACGGSDDQQQQSTDDALLSEDAIAADKCPGGSQDLGCAGVCAKLWAVVDGSDCSYSYETYFSAECC